MDKLLIAVDRYVYFRDLADSLDVPDAGHHEAWVAAREAYDSLKKALKKAKKEGL